MPDDIDRQVERDQAELDALLTLRKPVIKTTGYCLNCDEPLPPDVAYCDTDCRDDHEKELRAKTLRLR